VKKNIILPFFISAILCSLLFPDCDVADSSDDGEQNKIVLIWNKGYEGQTGADVMRGMIWTFSWLGAELPEGSFTSSVMSTDSIHFTVNFESLGFTDRAQTVLRKLCDSIRSSEEYKERGGIDIGLFSMITLGTSSNYYEIVGAPLKLDDFRQKYKLDSSVYTFGVTTSGIAEGHRLIHFSKDTSLFNYGFMAMEGKGSLDSGTFEASHYECFDVMPNGQLRFMIYDEKGQLVDGTPAEFGEAGKPAKCLWCHETSIQPLFIDNRPVSGMLTNEGFIAYRDSMQASLQRYRFSLKSDMNYENHQEHTLAELLYITYMEPTALHIAHEWGTTEQRVRDILKTEKSYPFEEFDYIGIVYSRRDVMRYDLRSTIAIPESARETVRAANFQK
jgi:hypothetical protein